MLMRTPLRFTFDHAFDSTDPSSPEFVDQATVFEALGIATLSNAWHGFNARYSRMAKPAGKSYCMNGTSDPSQVPGVMQRCRAPVASTLG